MKKVVFIDRDGTIIREPADEQIDTLEKLEFIPGIISGLKLLIESGFSLVMASNQDGLGTRRYPRKAYNMVQGKILTLLEGEGIRFEKIFICPHQQREHCNCRKPKTGLLEDYLKTNSIDYANSFVFGDRMTDVLLAKNLNVRAVRLSKQKTPDADFVSPDALEACRYIARSARSATLRRRTGETDIVARVALDGTGKYEISTGIGFFDHMLAQLAKHSSIDLTLTVKGDLEIDEHHTVEDTGIALGEAIRRTLGQKRGINRYGFITPLDEALAQVAIDLSGRRFCSFRCNFTRERVGELPTELVEDFFRAFADGLKATLHIRCGGRNDHHKIEAIFKATARALKQAIAIEPRSRHLVPSTKGVL